MRLLSVLALMLTLVSVGAAQPQPAEPQPAIETKLNHTALHPGQQAVAALVVEIPEGLHSQSHTPTEDSYVPFVLELQKPQNASIYRIVYPEGHDVEYPSLGKLNVYSGRVIAYIPLQVSADAKPGPLEITGGLQIQLCDDQACFRPFRGARAIPFTLNTEIVPAEQAIAAANDDLFRDFDPRVFAAGLYETGPPASATGTDIQFFGWSFKLQSSAYILAFAIAFAVGLVFNLMPCVLPVVPLKAIGFYEASQHSRGKCLLLGVIFCLGLLSMFAGLAVLVIVGEAAWGELFAKGWFVWSIVTVLIVLAAGQLGAFSVMLPQSVYTHVPSHSSYMGNYLFGGFTAILSTPCTAPMFLGLLLWAAGQPKALGVATVMTVGAGMAFPYLILAAFPQLARRIPRTGAWSELLKQFMAFLLLAVAAWFAAGRLMTGNDYMWIVFAIVLAGCVFLVVRTRMISQTARAVAIAGVIGVILSGGMLYFTMQLTGGSHELIAWEPYSQEQFDKAVADGRIVMLEFTANWCANCKELESRVFTDQRTADAVRDLNVLPIRADLTLDTAPGWEKLRSISKSGGIPLTMIYAPNLEQPIQLSSIYTTDNLVQSLRRASEGGAAVAQVR